jgi:hypothetical protein
MSPRTTIAVLLTGACLAAVPEHVRLSRVSERSGTALIDPLQRLGALAARTQTAVPAATPELRAELSEPTPLEAGMILPPPTPQDAV